MIGVARKIAMRCLKMTTSYVLNSRSIGQVCRSCKYRPLAWVTASFSLTHQPAKSRIQGSCLRNLSCTHSYSTIDKLCDIPLSKRPLSLVFIVAVAPYFLNSYRTVLAVLPWVSRMWLTAIIVEIQNIYSVWLLSFTEITFSKKLHLHTFIK